MENQKIMCLYSQTSEKRTPTGLVKIDRYSEVSAFRRFGQNVQFLSFFPFSLLYQDMKTFSDKKDEEMAIFRIRALLTHEIQYSMNML